jgi:cellobiose phosphorylase
MNKYGHYTDDGLEYVITTPHTPREWVNYLWNPLYLASCSQHMNGNSLYQNEAGIVTNLMGKQDMREDPRWIYVRDNVSGEVWSAGYLPCLTEHDEYACRHGLGYTILKTQKNGIELEFRIFVPREDMGEIWTIALRNCSNQARDISVFSVCNVMLDGVNMPYGYVGGIDAQYLPEDDFLWFRNMTHTVVNEKYRAFMYSDVTPDHWDVSKEYFLGKTKNYLCPERITMGCLGDSMASAEYLVGAMQHNMQLEAGSSETFNIVIGVVTDLNEARAMREAFKSSALIEAEFSAMSQANIQRVDGLKLMTPDNNFNRLFSVWMKHQLYLMSDWARFYFKGYRDTCQDAAGISVIDPERALNMLKKALINQRSDGFCPRAFRVASMDIAAADKHYADSPSWISHATDAILSETGDLIMLEEVVEYSDSGSDTIWQHNLRAMEFLWNDRGEHGLSLVHAGDWNDLMDKVGVEGRGEGVWMSMALARVLKLVGKIAGWRDEHELEALCANRFIELRKNILEHGWDDDHFIYSINDYGMRIGTNESAEGKYFINPQSWAMLAGVIDEREYDEIASLIEPVVDTPAGPVHNWPPFTEYDPSIGQLTGTPQGFFTNGNVYCHAGAFKVAADFDAQRTEKAFDTFMRLLPDEERGEPFAQVNGYVGPSALRMKHHVSDDPWRTGTVAWNMLNCVDRLLGFRRTLTGFYLQPLIPDKWTNVTFERPFRGTLFHIEIRHGDESSIIVDGKLLDSDFIAVPVGGLGADIINIICTVTSNQMNDLSQTTETVGDKNKIIINELEQEPFVQDIASMTPTLA